MKSEDQIELVEESDQDHQVPPSPPSSLLSSPLEAYTARLTSDADYAR